VLGEFAKRLGTIITAAWAKLPLLQQKETSKTGPEGSNLLPSQRACQQAEGELERPLEQFHSQTKEGVFSDQIERELSDAIVKASGLLGVFAWEGVESELNGLEYAYEARDMLQKARGASVAVMLRRVQLRYRLVRGVNALMGKEQVKSLLAGRITDASIRAANLDQFEKFASGGAGAFEAFRFDDHLNFSSRNSRVMLSEERKKSLAEFFEEVSCFDEIKMYEFLAPACANRKPAEFVSQCMVGMMTDAARKPAHAVLTWLLHLHALLPDATACEREHSKLQDLEKELEGLKFRAGYPAPESDPPDIKTPSASQRKERERLETRFWETFCRENPEFAPGGGKAPDHVLLYLKTKFPRRWSADSRCWYFVEGDDVDRDWLPEDELDLVALHAHTSFEGYKVSRSPVCSSQFIFFAPLNSPPTVCAPRVAPRVHHE